MRLLVVEDEPSLTRHLVASLGEAGYAVDSAANEPQHPPGPPAAGLNDEKLASSSSRCDSPMRPHA